MTSAFDSYNHYEIFVVNSLARYNRDIFSLLNEVYIKYQRNGTQCSIDSYTPNISIKFSLFEIKIFWLFKRSAWIYNSPKS